MRSPLERLTLDTRYLLFIASFGVLLLLGWWMGHIQQDPTSEQPRVAQMKLEFAANPEEVDYLKQVAWGEEGAARAQRLILWDFIFLVAYALLLSLGCLFAADGRFRHMGTTRNLGIFLAWGSLLAAAADIVANCAMLLMLHQEKVSGLVLMTAKTFASIQVFLIGLALAYMIAAMLLSLLDQGPAPSQR
jgi:hypothetical protein